MHALVAACTRWAAWRVLHMIICKLLPCWLSIAVRCACQQTQTGDDQSPGLLCWVVTQAANAMRLKLCRAPACQTSYRAANAGSAVHALCHLLLLSQHPPWAHSRCCACGLFCSCLAPGAAHFRMQASMYHAHVWADGTLSTTASCSMPTATAN